MTSTIPLTTIFTPPADCSSSWTFEAATYNGVKSGLLLQNAFESSMDASCFPPGFNHAGRGTGALVFSPGACPQGYTTNTPATTVESNTIASCCLSGYYFLTSGGMQGCISTHTGKTFVAARAGGFGKTDYTSSTTASGKIQMWGQPITIVYQASDQSLYTTSTSTSSASTSSTSTSSSLSTVSSATTSASSSHTLSGGAKAGIAVGSIVGVLFLLGIVLFSWRSCRQKRRQEEGSFHDTVQAQELDDNMAMRPAPMPVELYGRYVGSGLEGKDLPGHIRTPELE